MTGRQLATGASTVLGCGCWRPWFMAMSIVRFSSSQFNFGIFGIFLLKITHFFSVPNYVCAVCGILSVCKSLLCMLLCPFFIPNVTYFYTFPFMIIVIAISLFYSSFQITGFYVFVCQCSLLFLISLLFAITVFFRLLHHLDFLRC